MAPAVSDGFCQPLPTLTVLAEAVKLGAGNVRIEPVGVYVGRRVAAPALETIVGGQAYDAVKDAGICPAPAPPVAQDDSGPAKGSVESQMPAAARGSLGIQPSCRPREYDHAGDSTLPVTDELPIFHVQKNQFCNAVRFAREITAANHVPAAHSCSQARTAEYRPSWCRSMSSNRSTARSCRPRATGHQYNYLRTECRG